MFALKTLFVCGLAAVAAAKVEDALHRGQDTDNLVENLLLNDKGININTFIVDFLMNRETSLAPEEAYRITKKISAEETRDEAFLATLTRVLELGSELKDKISACEFTKDKHVDDFLDAGTVGKIRDQLIELSDYWTCSKKAEQKKGETGDELPNKMMSMMQWKHLQDLRDALQSDPRGVVDMCVNYLVSSGLISKEAQPMAQTVTESLVANPAVIDNALAFVDNLEMGLRSESGKRLMGIIPQLMEADAETALELFSKEAEYNQESFFNLIGNNDLAQHFFKQIARFLIGGYELAKTGLNDPMKFAIANGLLISNNFPALNKKYLLKSSVKILEKALTFVTVERIEDWKMLQKAEAFRDEFERLYFKMERMEDLKEEELEHVISQFLQDNVLVPAKEAYLGNKHVTTQSVECANYVLCAMNEHARKGNKIVGMITKGATYSLAYSWDSILGGKPAYKDLVKAIDSGIESEKRCEEIFPEAPKTCDVFTRERSKLSMDLSYDHNEL